MSESEINLFYPVNRAAWRAWLEENHQEAYSVWVLFYKKRSGVPTLSWTDAVEEALCFGWIDSKKVTIDAEKYRQYFCKRKASSTWSKINKDKVQILIDRGLMTEAGLERVEVAKENGSWTLLDSAEALIIPNDLEQAFKSKPGSKDFFHSLSKSHRKSILVWLVFAKRAETRQKRIEVIVELASQNMIPKQFR